MSVTDRHNITLAVKVALNLNTTNQPTMGIQKYSNVQIYPILSWLMLFSLASFMEQLYEAESQLTVDSKEGNTFHCSSRQGYLLLRLIGRLSSYNCPLRSIVACRYRLGGILSDQWGKYLLHIPGNFCEKIRDKNYLPHFIPTSFNPLPDNRILDWSKLKQNADNILKCI